MAWIGYQPIRLIQQCTVYSLKSILLSLVVGLRGNGLEGRVIKRTCLGFLPLTPPPWESTEAQWD